MTTGTGCLQPSTPRRTEAEGIPAALAVVASLYDPDVYYAKKRATTWIGYKVHLTETCDAAQPPLIVHVATTPTPIVDRAVLDPLHAALATKDLLPTRHLVDAAYIDADGLVAAARDHDVALTGPVPKDNQWQARTEGAFTIEAFHLDWDRQIATCPAEHGSWSWHPNYNLSHGHTDSVRGTALPSLQPEAFLHPLAAPSADPALA